MIHPFDPFDLCEKPPRVTLDVENVDFYKAYKAYKKRRFEYWVIKNCPYSTETEQQHWAIMVAEFLYESEFLKNRPCGIAIALSLHRPINQDRDKEAEFISAIAGAFLIAVIFFIVICINVLLKGIN